MRAKEIENQTSHLIKVLGFWGSQIFPWGTFNNSLKKQIPHCPEKGQPFRENLQHKVMYFVNDISYVYKIIYEMFLQSCSLTQL